MDNGARMYNTGLIGGFSSAGNLTAIGDYSQQGLIQDSGVNDFGGIGLECGTLCVSYGTLYSDNVALIILTSTPPATMLSEADTIYGGAGITSTTAMVIEQSTSTFICKGSILTPSASSEAVHVSNATLVTEDNCTINNSGSNLYAIDLAGTTGGAQMQNSVIKGGTTSIFKSTSGTTFTDFGGNTFTIPTGVLSTNVAGSWFLSNSNTTAFATSNIAMTSGFGTSTVTAASGNINRFSYTITLAGSPTTGAVATVTFPTALGAAPTSCMHSEGGTQLLTNVTLGTPTTTGVTVTYTGSLAAANTIVETLNCSN
jgi:hypothetical protein